MSNLLTISQAEELLGVSTKTIRQWEVQGRLNSIRTERGHRMFTVSDLIGNKQDNSLRVVYTRVSSHEKKSRSLSTRGFRPLVVDKLQTAVSNQRFS